MQYVFRMQKNYRQHIDQVKYSPVTDTPEIVLARKNAQLVSNVSSLYKSNIQYVTDNSHFEFISTL